jgi:hypothetical protein
MHCKKLISLDHQKTYTFLVCALSNLVGLEHQKRTLLKKKLKHLPSFFEKKNLTEVVAQL